VRTKTRKKTPILRHFLKFVAAIVHKEANHRCDLLCAKRDGYQENNLLWGERPAQTGLQVRILCAATWTKRTLNLPRFVRIEGNQ
jgi:hypothetical protein